MLEVVCVEAARMPHYCHWLVDTSLDSDQLGWVLARRTQNTTIARDLLPSCCLLSSPSPCLPGEGGGGGGCPLKILSGGGRGGGDVASQSPQHYLDTGRT